MDMASSNPDPSRHGVAIEACFYATATIAGN